MKKEEMALLIREKLLYDPEIGIISWKIRPERTKRDAVVNKKLAGKKTGFVDDNGYIRIVFRHDGKRIFVRGHQVAFAIMAGTIPDYIDHIDMDRSNNKWSNLRGCNQSENSANAPSRGAYKGVTKYKRKWVAQITHMYKKIYIGVFDTAELAALAYDEVAQKLFGEFARTNSMLGLYKQANRRHGNIT